MYHKRKEIVVNMGCASFQLDKKCEIQKKKKLDKNVFCGTNTYMEKD